MPTRYPREQMHRIKYTKLTSEQILGKLATAANGPTSASPLSDVFAGKSLKIVLDNGPTLSYRFTDSKRLSLTEGDAVAVQAGYGALTLDRIALFSHLIPKTQRGYIVVVDQDTNLATAFELWFSGYQDNREVQRQVYQGYVDTGAAAPTMRHGITNRVEGHGYFWKQDSGVETLEFYPSVLYSNFVELTRFGGELSWCAPSDYIKISDDKYIYSRVEAEFSGTMTTYVLDPNRVEQVGMRLGFDDADALEYSMFRGNGEWVGQIAQFEPFGDLGTTVAQGNRAAAAAGKGARQVYRPLKTNPIMTRAQVDAAVAKNKTLFAPNNAMAGNRSPMSTFLSGKELTLRYDNGLAFSYRFDGAQSLRWQRDGESGWHEEKYESFESAPGVIMFGHLLSGAKDHDAFSIVADFEHGLVTTLHGTMGTPYMGNESAVKTMFGVVEMKGLTPPKYRRHQFTDELVGRAMSWNYAPGTASPNGAFAPGLTSMHLYSTPHSLSWIIFLGNGAGGLEWSGPASYVKIRDELYFAYWLEEACNGTLGTILINMRTMRNCGIDYGAGTNGLRLSIVGAHARHAGRFNTVKYFTPKTSVTA
ncbi:MAG TPA: MoaF N-terminal domain-containing protein [Vicinamibacterales bacterium]|nr:MoaF N-terminal domain-containing protein [Vicinamibacterales bacterium]